MDPAYVRKGRISPKFDTYALGLMIVQLCCQMPSVLEVHGVLEKRDSNYTAEDTTRLFAGKLAAMENSLMEDIGKVLLRLGLECCEREPRDTKGQARAHGSVEQTSETGESGVQLFLLLMQVLGYLRFH
jgi:hypothetical protein